MKPIICMVLLCCLLVSVGLPVAPAAQSLRIAGITPSSQVYQALTALHPDVDMQAVLNPYLSTTELINDLLTGGFPYDTFVVSSNRFDVDTLIDKGYCLDLSDNPAIREAISTMRPAIADLVTRGDAIYGLPYQCNIQYMAYHASAWEDLGYSANDVPDSFPTFLSFLESWIQRSLSSDTQGYVVFNNFDEELYTETSYTSSLVRLLMEEHILQCAYTNSSLRFDTPAFRENLERCLEIGRQLHMIEPVFQEGIPLFEHSAGMENLAQMVPLRLTSEQPKLIECSVSICMAYAQTPVPALAEDAALCMLGNYETGTNQAYLFANAKPVENPNYAEDVAYWENALAELQAKVHDPDLSSADLRDLNMEVERYQSIVESVRSERNRYLITAEELSVFKEYQNFLMILPPHVFLARDGEEENVSALRERYVHGLLPTDQFLRKLDETAKMIEMEDK